MIEVLSGKNGNAVLKFEGRLLASRFDPRAEAALWVDRRKTFLDKVQTVFILGAGSGYHILELSRRVQADLIVIEPSLELIDAVIGLHKLDTSRTHFECVQSGKGLRACARVRKALKTSFLALVHPPSREGREKLFEELLVQLLGRDWGSLTWQWQLQDFGELAAQPRVTAERLTIYDLEQTELVQDSAEREKLLLKALRELVK